MKKASTLVVIIFIILVAAFVFIFLDKKEPVNMDSNNQPIKNQQTNNEPSETQTSLNTEPEPESARPNIEVIATGLKIPWDLAFLPDGSMLVTERAGNLLHVQKNGSKSAVAMTRAVPKGEGGLLGIVLHPYFTNNKYIYLYMTTSSVSSGTQNAVIRYKFEDHRLTDEKIIVQNIPGAIYHDGGRMEFGPDGLLYITTGDATRENIAQDLKSLGGKILRVTDEGAVPADNPFGTMVYSYGHRNPQGLTWDNFGNLWSTEHGRSGIVSGMDEVNFIEKGKNYGWPEIEGNEEKVGMVKPALHSGPSVTWAPASALYYKNRIFFGGLLGESLYEATLNGTQVTSLKSHFVKQFGRIRTVRLGPDGMFYITTSNRDGRGSPTPEDDRIIRVNPAQFGL